MASRREVIDLPGKLKVEGPDNPDQVKAAYKSHRDPHDRERLLAVRLAQRGGYTLAQIAEIVGRGRATIARWLRAFRAGGIAGLLERGHGGKAARLSAEQQEALREGLRKGRWKRVREIQQWIQEKCQVVLKRSAVYYWIQRLMGCWKVPRKSHIKKDPAAAEAFKKEIRERLEELKIPPGTRVQVWVEDEHRYGLISVIRRVWTLKGHRPTAPYQTIYQWGYIYGAANLETGQAEFLYAPTVSLEWSRAFLAQLVATDPEAVHVILWDNAGFHPGREDAELPAGVRLVCLPPYSPELNPIEPLWDQVKDRVANEVWATLEQIEAAITEVLAPYWQELERVRSLLGDTWLTRGVAAYLERHAAAPAN